MDQSVHKLNTLSEQQQLNVKYTYNKNSSGYICKVSLTKDHEVFDCYGAAKNKTDSQIYAAHQMLALLNLLFPKVPLAFFSQTVALKSKYIKVDYITNRKLGHYDVFRFPELQSHFYVYVDPSNKTYCVLNVFNNDPNFIVPECPLYLLNDPIRYTDWSHGAIISAQEAYLSKRLEEYYSNL